MGNTDEKLARRGLLCGIGAYGLWGLIPLYFKAVGRVPPLQVLSHRILWSAALLALLLTLTKRWGSLRQGLRSRRVAGLLALSSLLIGLNWLTYIYTVAAGDILQASLGYFITPLVNVLLGVVFLGERLRAKQLAGIGLALVGVSILTVAVGKPPWIALSLAVTFAFYGLIRKTVVIDGLSGLFVETMLLAIPSVSCLIYVINRGTSAFLNLDPALDAILVLSGIVTTIPLLLFGAAAKRLRMSTLGILQYLAPSVQFMLAVFLFKEPFSQSQLISFSCIWIAVAIYTYDSLTLYRRDKAKHTAQVAAAAEHEAGVDSDREGLDRLFGDAVDGVDEADLASEAVAHQTSGHAGDTRSANQPAVSTRVE